MLLFTYLNSAQANCTGLCKAMEISSSTSQPTGYTTKLRDRAYNFNWSSKASYNSPVGTFYQNNYQVLKRDAARGYGETLHSFTNGLLIFGDGQAFKSTVKSKFTHYFGDKSPSLDAYKKLYRLQQDLEKSSPEPDPKLLYFRRYKEIKQSTQRHGSALLEDRWLRLLAKLLAGERRAADFMEYLYLNEHYYLAHDQPTEESYERLTRLGVAIKNKLRKLGTQWDYSQIPHPR